MRIRQDRMSLSRLSWCLRSVVRNDSQLAEAFGHTDTGDGLVAQVIDLPVVTEAIDHLLDVYNRLLADDDPPISELDAAV